MPKRTKQTRLLEIVDEYRRRRGVTVWTTAEVTDWALSNGLLPVPSIRSSPADVAAWEERFRQIKECS